jgi:hypothetical protein
MFHAHVRKRTGNQHRSAGGVAAEAGNIPAPLRVVRGRRLHMTDKKKDHDRSQSKPKDRPRTERAPETARTPKSDDQRSSTDERRERPTEHGDRSFDPNVNQRPR